MPTRGKPGSSGGRSYFRPYHPGEPHPPFTPPVAVCLARIDHRCTGTIPGHELKVLSLEQDEHALRIEYEITPTLPAQPWISWSWSAQDDTGQTYEMAGGANGPSQERDATTGVLSLTPLLNPAARALVVKLNPALLPTWEERVCSFVVELPERPR